MDEETRNRLESEIGNLCAAHKCKAKIALLHKEQYVNRKWNPHPSDRFKNWWNSVGVKDTESATGRAWEGIDFIRAFNCQAVRDVYDEARAVGIA